MISSRLGRSTESQILLSHNNITLELDDGKALGLILFDYTKAFDVLNHNILLHKTGTQDITEKGFAVGLNISSLVVWWVLWWHMLRVQLILWPVVSLRDLFWDL